MDAPAFWRWAGGPVGRVGARPDCTRILPNLLVGEYPTPDDTSWLRAEQGVTAVLSLQDDADLASKGLELRDLEHAYRRAGLRFERMPVPDCDTDFLTARLDTIVATLHGFLAQGDHVYLHCNAGMNRAPSIAVAYLHVYRAMPLARARDFVKARRACVPYMRALEARYGAVAP